MARTDAHRPADFDPADYEVIDYIDAKRPEYFPGCPAAVYEEIIKRWQAEIFEHFPDWRTGGTDHKSIFQCNHCGHSGLRWVAVVLHIPTGKKLAFGEICADRCALNGRDAFRRKFIKDRAALDMAAMQNAAIREDFSRDNGDVIEFLARVDKAENDYRADMELSWQEIQPALDAWEAAKYEGPRPHQRRVKPDPIIHPFLMDMVHSLNRHGKLSEKQAAAVRKFMASQERRDAAKAQEAEALADTPALTEGKQDITGEVVSTKWHDSDFGSSLKMVVKMDNGNKVWGSVPSSLSDLTRTGWNDDGSEIPAIELKGKRVSFSATVTVSDTDEHFGFFKRPTKARLV